MMVFLSLLPQGLWQTYAAFTRDYAYARSAEVIQGPVMQALVWARGAGRCGVFDRSVRVRGVRLARDRARSAALTPREPRAAAAVLESALTGIVGHARSKRSRFITLFQAATKSPTNFSCASALP